MIRRPHALLGVALGIFLMTFLFGCDVMSAPTETPVPPTETPIPPTVTPVPSVSGGTLLDALGKVKGATTYRVDLSISGRGNFAAAGAPTPQAGEPDKPVTLVVMKGEVNGKDAHFTLQGILTAFLGIDPEKTFEVISHDGNAYLKGPVPLLGANEERWYQAPPQAASVAQPPLTPGSFLESFGETGINPADFKSAGTETLDGVSCEIFAGDKSAVVNAFMRLGGATGASQDDLDSIDNAEFKFWVCADGYLHQVKMLIEGHQKDDPSQKGAFEILMKIMDFDANIVITPPADAILLQLPEQSDPQASPTP